MNSSRLIITTGEVNFLNNRAINQSTPPTDGLGGGLAVQASEVQVIQGIGRVTVSHFINNTAFQGGAIYLSSANMT